MPQRETLVGAQVVHLRSKIHVRGCLEVSAPAKPSLADRSADLRRANYSWSWPPALASSSLLILVFDHQLEFVAGEIVEIQPARNTNGVAGNLGGKGS